jgi:hypothetical protein
MDKARLAKIVASANVETVTIPSTAGRQERDRLLRDFVKKAEWVSDGEVVLMIVRTGLSIGFRRVSETAGDRALLMLRP